MAINRFASGLTKQLQSAVGQTSLNYVYFSFTLPETNSHSPWK